MVRRIKRILILAALAGLGFALWRATARRRAAPEIGAPATWPPLQPDPGAALSTSPEPATSEAQDGDAAWVPPVDGACPVSHPVKVGSSGIYHAPGGRFYDRTRPARCYVDAAAAEADGYRAAKGS